MTVRRLPLGIAISVAAHVSAVALLATAAPRPVPPVPHTELVHVEILPPPEPEPMAIALLDEAPAVAPAPVAPRRPGASAIRSGAAHDEVARAASEPAGTSEPAGPAAPTSRYLAMRGSGDAPSMTKGLSQAFVDDMVARSKPLAPEVEPSGELSPSGGGRYHSDQGPFRVDVDKDGAAHLSDAPNVRVGIALPSRRAIGHAISQWAEDPYRDTAAAKRQRFGDYHGASDDEKSTSSNAVPIPVIGGQFDATDALMRRHGQDPYASKKLKVLDATRDERVVIGERYRKEQLVKASQLIKVAADRVWVSGLDVAGKKRALFELWDDCAEAGAPELVEAGQRARNYVVGFVASRLPVGSPAAFTAAELTELNAHRHSKLEFAPYRE